MHPHKGRQTSSLLLLIIPCLIMPIFEDGKRVLFYHTSKHVVNALLQHTLILFALAHMFQQSSG